uniref:Uncharacterized protein n=1 Tax=Craspedostauros australis TaxID=1486917 RepID=A0A7R9ZKH2_9STRA|mmetsp:Transcript_17714/g.49155  ORF Transcript_17714/g.49155 Transcript_17714/m.49155 type:complete len:126 (+) Transcript_17714:385-762(+)
MLHSTQLKHQPQAFGHGAGGRVFLLRWIRIVMSTSDCSHAIQLGLGKRVGNATDAPRMERQQSMSCHYNITLYYASIITSWTNIIHRSKQTDENPIEKHGDEASTVNDGGVWCTLNTLHSIETRA